MIHDIRPKGNRPSSYVLVNFKDRTEGDKWTSKVFELNKSFPENTLELRQSRSQYGSPSVFLTKQATESSRKPARMTNNCARELNRVELALPESERKAVKADTRGKQVSVGGVLVGFSHHGQWEWSEAGKAHLALRNIHQAAVTAAIQEEW